MSEHVYPAYEALVEQIARAVSYEATYQHAASRDASWSADVVIRLLAELPRLRAVLNADVIAAYEGDPAARSIEEIVFSYPTVEAITTHRIAHALHLEGVPIIPRIMAYHAHERTGVDIHPGASIDAGFFMDHGTGIVIGETATIGRNVKIYQGVTIGALSTRRAQSQRPLPKKRHPHHRRRRDDLLGRDDPRWRDRDRSWLDHRWQPVDRQVGRARLEDLRPRQGNRVTSERGPRGLAHRPRRNALRPSTRAPRDGGGARPARLGIRGYFAAISA